MFAIFNRLSGFENALLGYPSKIKPLLKRSVQQEKKLIDVHSFGKYLITWCLLNLIHDQSD